MVLLSISTSLCCSPPLRCSSSSSPSASSRQPHAACLFIPQSPRINAGVFFLHSFRRSLQIVRVAPDEEKMTRRSPLDFPIEWERPKPGRRPDIFPQFSPMKTPLPPPSPADPPEEDEEEEEKKEEEEENPDEENPNKPDQ